MTRDANLLTGFRLRNAEQQLGAYGIHLHRDGHESVEHRFRADDRVNIYSGSKTFTSLAVGIARGEGLLELEDAVVGFFDGTPVADGNERITVRDLLQMSSGNPFNWFEPPQDSPTDIAATWFGTEPVRPPGERFEYSNASTYLLGRIVHAVSGQDVREYLMPRLFDPLGIAVPQWHRCPLGFPEAAKGLHLTTSEFARLGRLLLQDGQWDGTQLVPADYVGAMHTDIVDTTHHGVDPESVAGYGYQVWNCTPDGAWRVDGKYGQFSIVLPAQRAVVTITAHNEKAPNDLLRAVWGEVLPRLR
ncbi:serine hydrolase domain-containing protein [Occultella glacieicola]|uniref:serine hydrolase domain-containing protein n=1 Tax=Occultella glacieicola TaxID=2518684 RepID=UPI001A9D1C27|nr:serine hydrolase [Occultella glacieicola]